MHAELRTCLHAPLSGRLPMQINQIGARTCFKQLHPLSRFNCRPGTVILLTGTLFQRPLKRDGGRSKQQNGRRRIRPPQLVILFQEPQLIFRAACVAGVMEKSNRCEWKHVNQYFKMCVQVIPCAGIQTLFRSCVDMSAASMRDGRSDPS